MPHLFALVVLALSLFLQPMTVRGAGEYRRLSREDNLSGQSVNNVMFDYLGQAWVATSNGVYIYNGRIVTPVSLPCEKGEVVRVAKLCESSTHDIFAATNHGIFRLRPSQSQFEHILPEIDYAEALLWHDGILYVANREGLHMWDGKQTQVIRVKWPAKSLDNSVRDVTSDTEGRVWFVSRYSLCCYNAETGKVKVYDLGDSTPKGITFSHLAVVNGRIFLGTKNDGLFVYTPREGVQHVKEAGAIINWMTVTSDSMVCVASTGCGALLIDGETLEVKKHLTHQDEGASQLPTDNILFYYRDPTGMDWVGTHRYGLQHSYYEDGLFRTFEWDTLNTGTLDIQTFCVDGDKMLVGSSEGLLLVDKEHGHVRCLPHGQMDGMNMLTCMRRFHDQFFVGSYDGGVRMLDENTMTLKRVQGASVLSAVSVSCMEVSVDGNLWVGTNNGLYVLHPEGSVDHYTEHNARIAGGSVHGIRFDSLGNGWLAADQGLAVYESRSRHFENTLFPDGFFHDQKFLRAVGGRSANVAFYNEGGLFLCDAQMQHWEQVTLPEGMCSEMLRDILDDRTGHYWVATDNGLFRLSRDMNQLQRFGYEHGVGSQMFCSNPLQLCGDTLWVGTSKGLLFTRISSVENRQTVASHRVLLYDIRQNEVPMPLAVERDVNGQETVRLSWNFLPVTLTAKTVFTDYARADGRCYQYRTSKKGDWTFLRDGEILRLSHLSLGNRYLEVCVAGETDTLRCYRIVVRPSLLCYMEMAAMLAICLFFFYFYNYRRKTSVLLTERREMEDTVVELEQQREQESLMDTAGRYERSRIADEECELIASRLIAYVEGEKAYVDPDLRMRDVAARIHVPAAKLSQVLSQHLNQNYYDFINSYRLAEFKRLIAEGQHRKLKITVLGERCGFRKTALFSTFRKMEGMSPAEWVQKNS